jgi:hypothetical protein
MHRSKHCFYSITSSARESSDEALGSKHCQGDWWPLLADVPGYRLRAIGDHFKPFRESEQSAYLY